MSDPVLHKTDHVMFTFLVLDIAFNSAIWAAIPAHRLAAGKEDRQTVITYPVESRSTLDHFAPSSISHAVSSSKTSLLFVRCWVARGLKDKRQAPKVDRNLEVLFEESVV